MSGQGVSSTDRGAVLALGFGTTVAMWGVGYVARLPFVRAPNWIVGTLLLLFLLAGGAAAARFWRAGPLAGVRVGLLAAVLNMLVLGSFLASPEDPNRVAPSAWLWFPGALIAGAVLGAVGAVIAGRGATAEPVNWTAAFAWVCAAATLLLVIAGGLVTSEGAGLAVTDWPNSFGYNMFLYPLSRMTGGVYYEHAHRLVGSLVGLTTLALAIHLFRVKVSRWVRIFGVGALAFVIVQGILGGLRVTGRFTMSASLADTEPSTFLATVHGVTGQLFFAVIVALACFTTRAWSSGPPAALSRSAGTDRTLSFVLVGCLVLQLTLGATLRQRGVNLLTHICMAVVVLFVALATGLRAWGLAGRPPLLRKIGQALIVIVVMQVLLGIAALIAVGASPGPASAGTLRAALATPHQVMGAVLLGCATALSLWTHRLLRPPAQREAEAVDPAPGQSSTPTQTPSASHLTG